MIGRAKLTRKGPEKGKLLAEHKSSPRIRSAFIHPQTMKIPLPIAVAFERRKSRFFKATSMLILSSILSTVASAQIIANFSGGTGNSSPDQYTGIVGGGWTSAWNRFSVTGITYDNTVINSAPLRGSGNYLNVSINNSGASAANGGVYRQFSSSAVSVAAPLEYSFLFRAETTSSASSYYYITNSNGTVFGGTNANNTWGIQYVGGDYWRLQNGNVTYVTGMKFNLGDVYSFVLTSNPEDYSYSIIINNLTNSESWTSKGVVSLSYRNQTGFLDGTALSFLAQAPGQGSASFSVGEIQIRAIPEPATVALLSLGAAGLAGARMQRRRNDGGRVTR